MFDKDYQEAMDAVQFSPDFEERTVARLEQALDFAARPNMRRRRKRWIVGSASAAAVLIAAIAITGQWRTNEIQSAMQAPDINVVVEKVEYLEETDQADGYEEVATLTMAPHATSAASNNVLYEEVESVSYNDSVQNPQGQPVAMNTSEYSHIAENGFANAATQPLSTFGADVDTASYANVRGILQAGGLPPVDAVRTEEFLNYFHYDYPEPADGEPFSVTTEIAPCPWNENAQLLLVGLNAKDVDASALPPSNLVFLIDVSGSMDEPNKLPLVQNAFRMLIEQLRGEDRVSIVTYAGSEQVLLDGASGDEKEKIMGAIDALFAHGSTNGESGIETAYALAQRHFIDGGNNRVILATDGDLNVGVTSEGELTRMIEQKKGTGVFLSVMGFGLDNLKDNKLSSLADHGNGNYSYIDSVLEARKVLVEQMGANFFTVCKDVKLQVEFNPAKVSQYRLIGYEKRAMSANSFADDAKDGGEIGAGHSVTALYELVMADDASDVQTTLKYQTGQLVDSSDYLTVSIRAKQPDSDVSQLYSYPVDEHHVKAELTQNMRFAAAVAEVCMVLRDSEYKGTSSYAAANKLLEGVPNLTEDPYKDEFAYLVRSLARAYP